LPLVVLVAGCATIRGVRAPNQIADTYEAQWRAAAQATESPGKVAEIKQGIVLARRARELNPNGVEGFYYYALNVGLLADLDRTYGLNAVTEMETALKRAVELDERFDRAGALRLLGILHLRTPGPPVSIGSPRKGLRLLQHAVELFPDDPENQLYLAEALRDNGRTDEARAVLGKIALGEPWQTKARLLRDSLDKP
jgi:tetratricopeptide (TPR) repeat protein